MTCQFIVVDRFTPCSL